MTSASSSAARPQEVAALGQASYAWPVNLRSCLVLVAAAAVLSGCERKATPSPEPLAATPPIAASPAAREGSPGAVARGVASGEAHGGAGRQFAKVDFPEVPIRAGATTTVKVAWRSPPGTAVNEEAPFRVRWDRSDALAEAPPDVKSTGNAARDGFHIVVKPLDGAPNATLGGVIDIVVCDNATHAVCVPVRRKVDIEFVVGKAALAETTVTVDLPQAKAL